MYFVNAVEKKDWRVDREDYHLSEQVVVKRFTNGAVVQKVLDVYAICPDKTKNLLNRKVIRIGVNFEDIDKVFGIEDATCISAKTLFDIMMEPENLKKYVKIISEFEVGYTSMDKDADLKVRILDKDISSYFANNEKIEDICNQLIGKTAILNKQDVKAIVKHNQSFEKSMFGEPVTPTSVRF